MLEQLPNILRRKLYYRLKQFIHQTILSFLRWQLLSRSAGTLYRTHLSLYFKNTDSTVKVEVSSTPMWFYKCTYLSKNKSQIYLDRHKSQILKGTNVRRSTSSDLKALHNSHILSNCFAFDSSKKSILDSNCALLQWLSPVWVPHHFYKHTLKYFSTQYSFAKFNT